MKKTALITGASLGIGYELARNFAKDGHDVVLVARNKEKLLAIAKEFEAAYNIKAIAIAKDLSNMDEVQNLYDELQSKNIHIDFLVNNAGFGDFGLFHQADWGKLEQMIDLNIKSLTKLSHLFVKPMLAKKFGKILQVASTAAFQPGPTMAVYYATKAYVLYLSEAMSNELQGTGVTVTALCPGATESGFQAAANLEESKLVKGKKLPSSATVADFGYRAMMNGKMTVIHGMMNWLMAQSIRFTPRKLAVKVVRMIQDK